MDEEQAVRAICDRLVEHLKPMKIVLFGSRATGHGRPDSDYDFLAVVRTDLPPAERNFAAHTAVADVPVPKDILVYTPEEYEMYSGWLSGVVREANTYGRVVYEAVD